jgi:hypothetical protein
VIKALRSVACQGLVNEYVKSLKTFPSNNAGQKCRVILWRKFRDIRCGEI